MPLFGQRQQRFRQQLDAFGVHRYLSGLGAEYKALDSDDIADIPLLKIRVDFLSHIVPTNVGLHLSGDVLYVAEARFSHDPATH